MFKVNISTNAISHEKKNYNKKKKICSENAMEWEQLPKQSQLQWLCAINICKDIPIHFVVFI